MSQTLRFPNGVITASLTPLHSDGAANIDLLSDHCHNLIERGANGILLLGTTGEGNSFSTVERMEILENLLATDFDPNRLMVSTGACAMTDAVSLTAHAFEMGINDVLVMPPFYYRDVPNEAIINWFSHLIERTATDTRHHFYLYHFPKMSGIDLPIDALSALASRFPENFRGMKDSGGDLQHMLDVIDAIPGFRMYAGSEKYLVEVLAAGGVGCISATVNYHVEHAASLYHQQLETGEGSDSYNSMLAMRTAFEGNPFIPTLKGMLDREQPNRGWHHMRIPNTPLPPSHLDLVAARLHGT